MSASQALDPGELGGTDVVASRLGLGTAALGTRYGAPGAERDAPARRIAQRTIARALEAGIAFIDTAPAYGAAELIVGEVCAGTDCVIATKIPVPEGGWPQATGAAAAAHVRACAERSLAVLNRDRIDLLQIHNADAALIARGEVVEALAELRHEGIVAACGATVYGEENALAAIRCPELDAVQIAYSALDRRPERSVIPAAEAAGVSLVARSVLLHGVLAPAGRALPGELVPLSRAADAFRGAAGASWAELPGAAVAFVLANHSIACTLLGPREADELDRLLSGAARFIDAAGLLAGGWDAELSPDVLDPSRWPREF